MKAEEYKLANPTPINTLIMMIQDTEWIRISDEGFWVRGVKVEQGPQEAEQVYQAFREFLAWSGLTRNY